MTDTYNTVSAPSEGIFKDKGSRFLAFLYPVKNEEEIRELLQKIKKEHYNARHHCYAWRLGKEEIRFRANDDGEPSSTAGKPILGQLVSKELTQVLLVVVRYFGGILLGTGGLIHAYREAAADAIRNASIETRLIEEEFQLNFNYSELNAVMQIIKNENLTQTSVNLTEKCKITLSVRKSDVERILSLFRNIYGVEISGSTSVNN
ncbi:MAG: YigZ family protein [Prolixibacteraceae bacterium]